MRAAPASDAEAMLGKSASSALTTAMLARKRWRPAISAARSAAAFFTCLSAKVAWKLGVIVLSGCASTAETPTAEAVRGGRRRGDSEPTTDLNCARRGD